MGGMHAQVHKALPHVQLVAAVDTFPELSRKKLVNLGYDIPVFESLSEALQMTDCDFVDICLPTYLHKDYALQVINAGKALFCEKPLALTLEEANAIVEAAEAKGTIAQVGHCIRFWPDYQRLTAYHNSGEGGRLNSLYLFRRSGRPGYGVDNWLNDEKKSGGAALDLHIHDTDFALSLLGEPKGVQSRVVRDYSGPVHVFSQLDYGDTTVVTEGGWDFPPAWGFQMGFQANYENAVIDFDSSNGKGLIICESAGESRPMAVTRPNTGRSASGEGNLSDLGGYFNQLQYFTKCLQEGKAPEMATLVQARDSLRVTLQEIENGSSDSK